MKTATDRPPVIAPVPGGTRPQWSVMIPVYNCATLLPQTLESVLQQDPGADAMQIEVVDDASTDADIAALVARIGKGRIQYYRQPQNVGSLKNFETCLNRARGYYVHLLHGDDKVRHGYYKKIAQLFEQFPEAGAAYCRYAYINEQNEYLQSSGAEASKDSILENWLVRIAQRQRLQYCAITVKRDVYEHLGGFYGVRYGEDWEMWVRLAAHYPVAYTPETLAEYRRHEGSISGTSFITGQNIRDVQWVMAAIQKLIPAEERDGVKLYASRFYAFYAMATANRLWQASRNKAGAKAQIREALHLHTNWKLYWKAAKLYAKFFLNVP